MEEFKDKNLFLRTLTFTHITLSMCREREGRTSLLSMIPARPRLLRFRLRVTDNTGDRSILKFAPLFASVSLQVTLS